MIGYYPAGVTDASFDLDDSYDLDDEYEYDDPDSDEKFSAENIDKVTPQ